MGIPKIHTRKIIAYMGLNSLYPYKIGMATTTLSLKPLNPLTSGRALVKNVHTMCNKL